MRIRQGDYHYPFPIVEEPKDSEVDGIKFHLDKKAYNNWKESGILMSDDLKAIWADGEKREDSFYEVFKSEFYSGNYQNKCTICKKLFNGTDKLWFVCQTCCKGIAIPKDEASKDNYVASVQSPDESSVVSLPSTVGNSIEEDLKRAIYEQVTLEFLSNPNGTRMDIVYEAMERYYLIKVNQKNENR